MARPTNAETIQRQRRRRTDNLGPALRLSVVGELDRENYDYRWIRDDDARMHRKTVTDDWDVVRQDAGEMKDDATGLGSAVAVRAGTKANGDALNLVLCRKPKEFAEADRAALEEQRRKVENQMRRGALPSTEGAVGPAYYTHQGNRIG